MSVPAMLYVAYTVQSLAGTLLAYSIVINYAYSLCQVHLYKQWI